MGKWSLRALEIEKKKDIVINNDIYYWSETTIPGTWNLKKFYMDESQLDAQGVFQYKKEFNYKPIKGKKPILTIEQAFKKYKVILNGVDLGEFKHAYLSAQFDLSSAIVDGKNTLEVIVSNIITKNEIPSTSAMHGKKMGWFPYGGITGRVFITNEECSSPWQVFISKGVVRYNTLCNKKFQKYNLENDEAVVLNGFNYSFAKKDFKVSNKRILAFGENFPIKGINRHADTLENGPIFDYEEAVKDINLLKELNVNFIRPGHYPNDPRFLQLLDESGIKYAQEVPIYQWGKSQFKNKELRKLTMEYLERLLIRDSNRPGLMMISLSNEVLNFTNHCGDLVSKMHNRVKELAPELLTMNAVLSFPQFLVLGGLLKDRCSHPVDVIGINNYAGWYFGKTDYMLATVKRYRKYYPNKPMFLSEFGAGAVPGLRIDNPREEGMFGHSYSEDFQAWFIKRFLDLGEKSGELVGYMPWVLSDFRMQWTTGKSKKTPPGFNMKGLTSYKREKKEAFFVLRDFYLKD
jgi:beta-glucuronidase